MVLEGELLDGEKELISLAGVVARGQVKDDGDVAPDVLDNNSLRMKVDDGGGLVEQ